LAKDMVYSNASILDAGNDTVCFTVHFRDAA
jgi:hypothetical protein